MVKLPYLCWKAKGTPKVHKHEIILNFFLPKANLFLALVRFQFFSFDFCQNFDVRTLPRWLSILKIKFYWWAIKNFFSKNFHFGLIRWVPRRRLFIVKICILIWYFPVIFENYSMHMLSIRILRFYRTLIIRGNNFIAHRANEERIFAYAQPAVKCEQFLHVHSCWSYAEQISSHIEHTRNEFGVTGPWDHKVPEFAKKYLKKIHACVPLNYLWACGCPVAVL